MVTNHSFAGTSPMIRQRLGRTDLHVTRLGYGSMGLRGPRTWGVRVVDDERAEAILNAVLDAGINFIDTAPDYGLSEERIGRFIGSRRREYHLATKCGCAYTQHEDRLEIAHVWKPEVVRRNLEDSPRRLRTDHVDVLQFHGGDAETLRREGLIDLLMDSRGQDLVHSSAPGPRLQAPGSCRRQVRRGRLGDVVRQHSTGAGMASRGPSSEPVSDLRAPADRRARGRSPLRRSARTLHMLPDGRIGNPSLLMTSRYGSLSIRSRSQPGRSVVMPSKPRPRKRRADSGAFTVHT